jgi:hypothetical protein
LCMGSSSSSSMSPRGHLPFPFVVEYCMVKVEGPVTVSAAMLDWVRPGIACLLMAVHGRIWSCLSIN